MVRLKNNIYGERINMNDFKYKDRKLWCENIPVSQIAEEVACEIVTVGSMILHRPPGVGEHGDQGEDDEHHAANGNHQVQPAELFRIGKVVVHRQDYTQERNACQAFVRAGPKKL